MIFSALTGGSLVRRSRAEHRRAVPPIDADAAPRTPDNGASAVSSRQAPRAAATLQRARTRPPSKGAFYRRRPSALALSLALITAGCGGHPVGPDYRPPASALLSRAGSLPLHDVEHDTQAASSGAIASAQPLPVYWWRLYQDPRLDDLVRQALARNTDLRLAMANLERQQALLQEASSAQNPTLSANAEPYYGHPSGLSVLAPGTVPDNAWRYDGGLSLSYQ
ncbi:hypothetical protein SODG_006673 [Sodalis praecaptivus]|nr:hypothetical protein NVIRENTERO_01235 [Sodalis praecaptivus]